MGEHSVTDQPTAQSSTLRWLPVLIVVVLVLLLFVQLRDILMPFAVGALIAYLGDPLVDRLEARGFTRTSGVALVFALADGDPCHYRRGRGPGSHTAVISIGSSDSRCVSVGL